MSTYHRIAHGDHTVLANSVRTRMGTVNSNIALLSLKIARGTPEYSV